MSGSLTRDKAYIFRITRRENVAWILSHGMHCRNSSLQDPNFVTIGNVELIGTRHTRVVPHPPGGTLSDYVPFYFTPFTPMFYNIRTGFNGVRRHRRADIVIVVSSLPKLRHDGVPFLFTDR